MTSIRDASRRHAASRSLRFARRLAPAPTRDEPCPATSSTKACTLARAHREASGNGSHLHHALARAVRAQVGEPQRGCQGSGAPGTGTWCRICRRSDRCAPAGRHPLRSRRMRQSSRGSIECHSRPGDAWGARGVCVATGNPWRRSSQEGSGKVRTERPRKGCARLFQH